MKSLTCLELLICQFARLPAAISQITTLRHLCLFQNEKLQLEADDVDVLAALPHLESLVLEKDTAASSGWSERSVGILRAISERLPHLRINQDDD